MVALDRLYDQTPEDVENCLQLCREYIAGPWRDLNEEDFDCKIVTGGLCNRVFTCINKKLLGKGTITMPEKVLVRKYGSDFVGKRGDMINISDSAIPLVSQVLYHNGLGPKLYGVFEGGRVEEFIEHDDISVEEKHEMKYLEPMMKTIARIHDLEMPISKCPLAVFNMVHSWFEEGRRSNKFLFEGIVDPEYQDFLKELAAFDYTSELDWFEKRIPLVRSRQVFTHNDIQFANIFLRKEGKTLEEKVFLIDYENCSYGFRGYDLAFFLYSKSIDFFRDEFWKYIFWPEESVRRKLLSIYLDEHVKKLDSVDPEIDNVDHLMFETDFFLFLVIFLRICVGYKKCSEEFLESVLPFESHQIKLYAQLKKELIEKYPILNEASSNGNDSK